MRSILFSMLAVASCATAANVGISIHVIDGKHGKPVANEHLLVFYGDSEAQVLAQKHHFETRTNSAGDVLLNLVNGFLQVWIDRHPLCQPSIDIFNIETIQSSGIVAPDICGSATHQALPGNLYLFVRKETLVEGMRH